MRRPFLALEGCGVAAGPRPGRAERAVGERQPRQGPSIQPIVVPAAVGNQPHAARFRHYHVMSESGQLPAHPRRVRPYFDCHPAGWQAAW